MAPARHDVAIVGGGLVGASLAIALERTGLDVALIEATPAGALPPVFDERNLSFAEATVNALSALGVLRRDLDVRTQQTELLVNFGTELLAEFIDTLRDLGGTIERV